MKKATMSIVFIVVIILCLVSFKNPFYMVNTGTAYQYALGYSLNNINSQVDYVGLSLCGCGGGDQAWAKVNFHYDDGSSSYSSVYYTTAECPVVSATPIQAVNPSVSKVVVSADLYLMSLPTDNVCADNIMSHTYVPSAGGSPTVSVVTDTVKDSSLPKSTIVKSSSIASNVGGGVSNFFNDLFSLIRKLFGDK